MFRCAAQLQASEFGFSLKLIEGGVKAENKRVIFDRLKIGNVGVRIKLPSVELVLRNFDLAIEKGDALFGNYPATVRKITVKLQKS